MANLNESATWVDGIYQLEQDDYVQGGPDGIDNVQAKALANRTSYLKQQVETLGTGKVDQSAKSSTAQAQAGTDDTTWMTPAKVAQAISQSAVGAASETVSGKVELATEAETITGTDKVRATHSAGVKAAISAAITAALAGLITALSVRTPANDATYSDNSANPASTSWIRGAISAIAVAAGFSYSFGTNSYIKFPSWFAGFIINWGTIINSPTPGTDIAVTFPLAFPTAIRGNVWIGNASSSTSGITIAATLPSNTGFKSSCSVANITAAWLAFGN